MASVHFTQIVNNKKMEMHLCKQCAKEKGQINFGPSIEMNDFFTGLMGMGYNKAHVETKPVSPVCERCGTSYEDFQRTGKLGCNNCYTIYKDSFTPLLRRLHGNVEHHGKFPKKISKNLKTDVEIERLKELLNRAVEKEEYEEAAQLRDKIKDLEKSR
jgi:protein arginine kinase activator